MLDGALPRPQIRLVSASYRAMVNALPASPAAGSEVQVEAEFVLSNTGAAWSGLAEWPILDDYPCALKHVEVILSGDGEGEAPVIAHRKPGRRPAETIEPRLLSASAASASAPRAYAQSAAAWVFRIQAAGERTIIRARAECSLAPPEKWQAPGMQPPSFFRQGRWGGFVLPLSWLRGWGPTPAPVTVRVTFPQAMPPNSIAASHSPAAPVQAAGASVDHLEWRWITSPPTTDLMLWLRGGGSGN
ncbi:MAG: hypothetical protein GMKNLPBB_02343 [Myxococcota bacterium]|nr:hypothetical protein [Myxococcota bacterium]